ncbi:hypothetical protein PF005_g30568 [Phytophthora fragariae]|uniref:Uncharacterized protein n=1 Tax=Phytophthora fragariae TaxID=53985 RepID=A0A6A3VAX4_9STRA|nr:hypothetical protein PF005_g30568 [Phytophthora fragariae]
MLMELHEEMSVPALSSGVGAASVVSSARVGGAGASGTATTTVTEHLLLGLLLVLLLGLLVLLLDPVLGVVVAGLVLAFCFHLQHG